MSGDRTRVPVPIEGYALLGDTRTMFAKAWTEVS